MNFNVIDEETISIALNETVDTADLRDIVGVFATALGRRPRVIDCESAAATLQAASPDGLPASLRRTTAFLTHPVFNTHHSETGDDALHPQPRAQGPRPRHVHDSARLVHDEAERGDRDAADYLEPVQPHAPVRARDQAEGYAYVFRELEAALCEITGFARGLAAAELRGAGRVHGPDGDSRVSPRSR